MDDMQMVDAVTVEVIRAGKVIDVVPVDLVDQLYPGGKFGADHYDKDGQLLNHYDVNNLVVNVGKNYILDVMFNSGTQIGSASWFIGLISNSGYSAIAAADTMASHAGWTEFTGYSESVRQTWGQGAAASQSITNATPATFSINASGTVKGAFITSNSTKGGTTGTLWAAALFSADVR